MDPPQQAYASPCSPAIPCQPSPIGRRRSLADRGYADLLSLLFAQPAVSVTFFHVGENRPCCSTTSDILRHKYLFSKICWNHCVTCCLESRSSPSIVCVRAILKLLNEPAALGAVQLMTYVTVSPFVTDIERGMLVAVAWVLVSEGLASPNTPARTLCFGAYGLRRLYDASSV